MCPLTAKDFAMTMTCPITALISFDLSQRYLIFLLVPRILNYVIRDHLIVTRSG